MWPQKEVKLHMHIMLRDTSQKGHLHEMSTVDKSMVTEKQINICQDPGSWWGMITIEYKISLGGSKNVPN